MDLECREIVLQLLPPVQGLASAELSFVARRLCTCELVLVFVDHPLQLLGVLVAVGAARSTCTRRCRAWWWCRLTTAESMLDALRFLRAFFRLDKF
jgi:hypothetical protein